MLKFVKKLFTDPEKIDQSCVDITYVEPKNSVIPGLGKTKTQVFDEAVAKVVRQQQRKAVEENLKRFVLGADEYDQSIEAIKYNGNARYIATKGQLSDLREKFPLLKCNPLNMTIVTDFSMAMLLDKIIDEAESN